MEGRGGGQKGGGVGEGGSNGRGLWSIMVTMVTGFFFFFIGRVTFVAVGGGEREPASHR